MIVAVHLAFGLAPGRVVVPGLVEAARPQQILRPQRLDRLAPGDRPAGEQQRLRKMLAHQIEVVDDDHDRAAFAMPALDQRDQVATRLGVDRIERLVEQDQLGVLHQHARKQRALQLAARQRVDRPLLEAVEADRRQRLRYRRAVLVGEASEQPALRPQAERNQIDDARRKGAVDFGLLRQIGDAGVAYVDDGSGHRLQHADDALHQGRFARTVGADDGGQRAGRDRPAQMMHGRMAVVAERQIFEDQARLCHRDHSRDSCPVADRIGREFICNVITSVNISAADCGDRKALAQRLLPCRLFSCRPSCVRRAAISTIAGTA